MINSLLLQQTPALAEGAKDVISKGFLNDLAGGLSQLITLNNPVRLDNPKLHFTKQEQAYLNLKYQLKTKLV